MARSVKKLHAGERYNMGDLPTWTPLPAPTLPHLDPFLLLNHHGRNVYPPNNRGLPFEPHPHRGFETVTFIIKGDVAHRDSRGGESVILPGGIQWMTAGRGLVHEEISSDAFKKSGGPLDVVQLWINLPARLKMVEPAYRGLQKADIPEILEDGGKVVVHLISGEWKGRKAPIASLSDVHMTTIEMKKDGTLSCTIAKDRTVFCYVVRGHVLVNGLPAPELNLVEFNDDSESIEITAGQDSQLLFGHAAPLKEPIAARGPFVMNTQEEIVQAVNDYQTGKIR